MKKAMRQAAGTAVLGVALAAAAVTPAAAAEGGLDGVLGSVPNSAVPTGALSNLTDTQTGSLHAVTGTAQGLVNTAAPSVQSAAQGATQSVPGLGSPMSARALPVDLPGALPVVNQLPGVNQATSATSGGLSTVTSSLPVHSPLG